MAYWLYERVPEQHIYKQQRKIRLFGNQEGLIYHAIKTELPKALEGKKGFFWTRTAYDLLRGRDYDPNRHSAVIDFAPERPDPLVGLIRGIAGHTVETWTPFIVLCDVFDNISDRTKIELEEAHDRCCTVLYAQGGWGQNCGTFIPQGGWRNRGCYLVAGGLRTLCEYRVRMGATRKDHE